MTKIYSVICPERWYLQGDLCNIDITTKVGSSNPAHGEVCSIQHYVIKFVSDLRQVCDFLQVPWFPPPIKLKFYPEVGLTFLRDTNFLTNGKTYCTSPADDRHIITILLGLLKFLILGKYYQHDTWLLMPYFLFETDNVGVRVMVCHQ
jgi:hypothetical protein